MVVESATNPGSQPDEGGKTKPSPKVEWIKEPVLILSIVTNLKKKEQKEEVELQELDIKGAVTGKTS